MSIAKLALAALVAFGGVAPAAAQGAAAPVAVTRAERNALSALQTALAGSDRAAQDAALAAARTAAQSPDARYALARLELEIARQRGDNEGLARAVDALVASNRGPENELVPLLANQASRAYSAGQFDRADALLQRMAQLRPSDPAIAADYAQLKARRGDRQAAVAGFAHAIELQRAAGQPVPESWYARATALAYDGRMMEQAVAFARDLVTFYPSPQNWRDAILIYRASQSPPAPAAPPGERPATQPGPADRALDLDIRRLMRATRALSGERDYLEFADQLAAADKMGEAKAVLDEGVERGMVDGNEPAARQMRTRVAPRAQREHAGLAALRTRAASGNAAQALAAGDAYYGDGQYAVAAELYQAALQKAEGDANLINTRLGAALALAGRRSEAEAAFRAVSGPRAGLAALWLAWLSRSTQP
jgi:hypothetical protein